MESFLARAAYIEIYCFVESRHDEGDQLMLARERLEYYMTGIQRIVSHKNAIEAMQKKKKVSYRKRLTTKRKRKM